MKDDGYLLAIDPATSTGIAIFDLQSEELIECFTLRSNPKDTWGQRCVDLIDQFKEVAREHLHHIQIITYEKNKRTSVLVSGLPMVFAMACPGAVMNDATGIVPSEWKSYVRRRVDTTYIPVKGIEALEAIHPDWIEAYGVDSEDSADACLVGLAFLEKRKKGVKKRKAR